MVDVARVLHGILHERILRQVHSLPRGHACRCTTSWTRSPTAKPPRRDLALLEELCDMVRNTSLCGLGQTAPNPVLSTLRYFREEYDAHVDRQRLSGRSLQDARTR